jgi:hypothetical protein
MSSLHPVDSRPQPLRRGEALLGILFVLSLVMGAILWDEMAFAGEPWTSGSRMGLAFSVGICALLLVFSRGKWPLLLCALLFASIRIPNVWLQSAFPKGLHLLVDCFAASISLFAVCFRAEIAEIMSHTRQTSSDGRRSGAPAGPATGSPMESHALATLNHARAASTAIRTVEPLPSSPA